MSKERELLKRVRDTLRELKETHYDLYWDIQAELDLAPPKREPLSEDKVIVPEWMFTRDECIAFAMGVKFAEDMHGIGVENE